MMNRAMVVATAQVNGWEQVESAYSTWDIFQRPDDGWWMRLAIEYDSTNVAVGAESYLVKFIQDSMVYLPVHGYTSDISVFMTNERYFHEVTA